MLVIALVLAALAPAAASAVPTGAIEGTVTGTDTQEGIEGVEVCATRYEPTFLESCELTAADGTYAIEGLGAGEYEVAFYAHAVGYRSEFLPGSVTVGTEPVTEIDAELAPFSQITGTVTGSADGQPIEGVEVCAWELTGEEEYVACSYTEEDGTYVLDNVEPGEYGVEFWPYETGLNLIGEVYDNRERWQEADPVVVGEGETVSGIDAALDPGATISGHVYSNASGAALEEIPVCAVKALTGELWVCDWTRPDGRYELPYLSAGPYKVVFSIDFEEWYGEEFEEENDGFPTEYWNEQTSLAAANVIAIGTGESVTGIDARLGPPATEPTGGSGTVEVQMPPPEVIKAVPPSATTPSAPVVRRKHCRKGFRRKKVGGKVRCVRVKKHRHQHRRSTRSLALPAHLRDR
ncbi:MAG TPA: carboxypeptidase-like regulatory domain-containing protein [Solirubrobacterales bacterium]|nr:carboxypeptidase-like regulatory domain-containing protein [Solirubrobacterales bacterium]